MSSQPLDNLVVPYVAIYRTSDTSLDSPLVVREIDECRVILDPRAISFSYTAPNVRQGPEGGYSNPLPVTVTLPRDSYLVVEFMVRLEGGLSRRVAAQQVLGNALFVGQDRQCTGRVLGKEVTDAVIQ